MSHCIYYTDRAVQNEQILQLSITRRLLSLAYGKRYKQLTPEFGHFHLKMVIFALKWSFFALKWSFFDLTMNFYIFLVQLVIIPKNIILSHCVVCLFVTDGTQKNLFHALQEWYYILRQVIMHHLALIVRDAVFNNIIIK